MRKSLMVLLAAALMLVPVAVNAQTSAQAQIAVNATVQRGITLAAASPTLDFGAFVANSGVTPSIDPITNVSNGISAGNAVQFDVTGHANRNITFSWVNGTISNAGTDLTFSPSVAGGQTTTQSSATAITNGTGGQLTNGSPGEYHVWVGGTLTAIGAVPVGTYAGNWTLTVQYN